MACAGDVPTLETIAAVGLLRQHLPELKIRVVNVVDLMTLQPNDEHPHGITDRAFDGLFTRDRPVIFAYHGYPYLIHRLTYRRRNHDNMHVHGFKEEGTTTTPFDMAVLNELDRFHLAMDVIARVPGLPARAAHVTQHFRDKLIEHSQYIRHHGEDMPEIRNWSWAGGGTAQAPTEPQVTTGRHPDHQRRLVEPEVFPLARRGPDADLQEVFRGEIEKIGIAPRLAARTPGGDTLLDKTFGDDGAKLTHEALLQELFAQQALRRP